MRKIQAQRRNLHTLSRGFVGEVLRITRVRAKNPRRQMGMGKCRSYILGCERIAKRIGRNLNV